MKGITPVIALVLLMLITVGMVGVAYTWFSGMFTTSTSLLKIVDSYCVPDTATTDKLSITVRNDGTVPVRNGQVTVSHVAGTCASDIATSPAFSGNALEINEAEVLAATGCLQNQTQQYRLVLTTGGLGGQTISIYCP